MKRIFARLVLKDGREVIVTYPEQNPNADEAKYGFTIKYQGKEVEESSEEKSIAEASTKKQLAQQMLVFANEKIKLETTNLLGPTNLSESQLFIGGKRYQMSFDANILFLQESKDSNRLENVTNIQGRADWLTPDNVILGVGLLLGAGGLCMTLGTVYECQFILGIAAATGGIGALTNPVGWALLGGFILCTVFAVVDKYYFQGALFDSMKRSANAAASSVYEGVAGCFNDYSTLKND